MKATAPMLLCAALVFLTGCGGSGGGEPVGQGMPDGAMSPAADVVPEVLIEGVWETSCFPAVSPASGRRYVVAVTDTVFSFRDTTYGDASCIEESAQREIETRGTLTERMPESGRRIEDGVPIDLAVDQVVLTPRLPPVASRYNELMLCDATVSTWVSGVEQDISGCADESGTIDVDTTAPRTDYNLFLVDDRGTPRERADDRLQLGTVDSQPDPERRPVAVSQETSFTRRPGTL